MTRRSFFASLFAAPLARFIPKPPPLAFHRDAFTMGPPFVTPVMAKACAEGLKGLRFDLAAKQYLWTYPTLEAFVGDTIIAKRPKLYAKP